MHSGCIQRRGKAGKEKLPSSPLRRRRGFWGRAAIHPVSRALPGRGASSGWGYVAITQQPKLIDKQLLSQFNTLWSWDWETEMTASSWKSRPSRPLLHGYRDSNPGKGRGRGIHPEDSLPVPARIHRYEDYLRRLDKEDKQEQLISRGGFKPFLE